MAKLPKNKLVVLPNEDKKIHEKWHEKRNLCNIPHPARVCILGKPNSGKTLVIKNLLLRQYPPFEKISLIHCDGANTQEYNDVDVEILEEIPSPDECDETIKQCVILDDLEYKTMSKEQQRNLDRLFGYCSTHKNITVYLTAQDPFNVPPIVRRCSNLFILWRSQDMDSLANLSRKSGLKSHDLKYIFKTFMKDKHDSLWIDLSGGPMLRKNCYETIEKNDED